MGCARTRGPWTVDRVAQALRVLGAPHVGGRARGAACSDPTLARICNTAPCATLTTLLPPPHGCGQARRTRLPRVGACAGWCSSVVCGELRRVVFSVVCVGVGSRAPSARVVKCVLFFCPLIMAFIFFVRLAVAIFCCFVVSLVPVGDFSRPVARRKSPAPPRPGARCTHPPRATTRVGVGVGAVLWLLAVTGVGAHSICSSEIPRGDGTRRVCGGVPWMVQLTPWFGGGQPRVMPRRQHGMGNSTEGGGISLVMPLLGDLVLPRERAMLRLRRAAAYAARARLPCSRAPRLSG